MKALEIKTAVVFNLVFVINTISLCFFSVFLNYLYFLITAVISQIFNPTVELPIPIEIPTNEAKTN